MDGAPRPITDKNNVWADVVETMMAGFTPAADKTRWSVITSGCRYNLQRQTQKVLLTNNACTSYALYETGVRVWGEV